jgi:signal transduction histidine kinase
MRKYINYKTKLFLYFFIVFTVFTAVILSFQYKREKEFKIEQLESKLNIYNQIVNKYITNEGINDSKPHLLSSIATILPNKNLRITLIDEYGKVLFDNDVENSEGMENHLYRPEIMKSLYKDYGTATRYSKSLSKDYYYYAKRYKGYYIRVALPYNIEVKNFLKADNLYIYFLLLIFIVVIISLIYISDKLGKSISTLKDFAVNADNNSYDNSKMIDFQDNELGIISNRIVSIYNRLNNTKEDLIKEKEKLIMHFHNSEHGIAIFNIDKEKIFANAKFIQYLNIILDTPAYELNKFLESEIFSDLLKYINKQQSETSIPTEYPRFKTSIYKNSKYFTIKSIVFEDNSFEISIIDSTILEKTRILKQEMTSNIAHELRTPVTSIRGFLETIIENKDIDKKTHDLFIDKSYKQVLRLSELLSDISIITKTEEAPDKFDIEKVSINKCLEKTINDLNLLMNDNNIRINSNIYDNVIVNGNKILLSLLLRNLIDNSLKHVGHDVEITFNKYHEDENYYYFSYSDNGEGVKEEYLNRLFERFYRPDTGRTRKTGGTGLGLAIVKNAVLFHGGEITAKNKQDGGLEFLFTLKKT